MPLFVTLRNEITYILRNGQQSDRGSMSQTEYSVGDFAKKMGLSVRTLQYYDRINLLKPSSFTVGGRRLYHPSDAIRLQHILSLHL